MLRPPIDLLFGQIHQLISNSTFDMSTLLGHWVPFLFGAKGKGLSSLSFHLLIDSETHKLLKLKQHNIQITHNAALFFFPNTMQFLFEHIKKQFQSKI